MSEALTDEELAAINVWANSTAYAGPWAKWRLVVVRLIADLRAKDQQIAVLEAKMASAERMRAASFDRAERMAREVLP